jgi:predicted RNase H-like HicB family nuclease
MKKNGWRFDMNLCVFIRRGERGGYCATCPVLPGCIGRGQTEQQARLEIHEAIRGYLASISDFVPEKMDEMLQFQTQQ